jgi:phosphoribosylglycinamide formyltransferase-1
VIAGDDETSLAARVLAQEHLLLPAAVGWYCAGRVTLRDGRVEVRGVPDAARARFAAVG